MTTQYYAPPDHFQGDVVVLPDEEAHHAVRVLRQQAGDEVVVVDGEGGWHRVELDRVDKRTVSGHVVERRQGVGEPAYALTIGLALLKNHNRFETFLEKAVELGVTHIRPLITRRTEQRRLKTDRARNILIAAMKQSYRSVLPVLYEPASFDEALQAVAPGHQAFLCHEQADAAGRLSDLIPVSTMPPMLHVLIGPEGGFSEDELRAARERGVRLASLGPRRLRAETAAMVAATAVMMTCADRAPA